MLALWARAILAVFEKIYSCLFISNCTRNNVITYTNNFSERIKVRGNEGLNFFLLLWSAGYLEDRGLTYDLLIRLVLS